MKGFRAQKFEALNAILNASLAGVSPRVDLAAVLGLLEATCATGIFRAREGASMKCKFYLRFRDGRIVKAMGGTASEVVGAMLRSEELYWIFRAVACRPNGDIDESVTGLLLRAATLLDNEARNAVDSVPSLSDVLNESRRQRIGSQLRFVERRRAG